MPWPVHPTGFFGARGDSDTYRIERSLRFNSADSAYLNRTPASAGNRNIWTLNLWVKKSSSGFQNIFGTSSTGNSNNSLAQVYFDSSDRLGFFQYNSTTTYTDLVSTRVFRDYSAWYMLTFQYDDTQATSSNRVKLYVNGEQITSFASSSYPTQNFSGYINLTNIHYLARDPQASPQPYFGGYLTEINFIDGQALTPSSFGETDSITGRWKAKAYSGTYGTNGFYLKFADNSGTTATTLGKDSSGNGNNWTPNNFSVTAGAGNDSLVDSPTNYGSDTGLGGEVRGNYCTLNPLQLTNSATAPNNGNLTSPANSGAWRRIACTIQLPTAGKWYFEYNCDSFSSFATFSIGVFSGSIDTGNNNQGYLSTEWAYDGQNGYAINNNISISSGFTTATTGDVLRLAYDADTGKIWFGKNNTWQGASSPNPATGTSATYSGVYNVTPLIIQNWAVQSVNFGQRPFAYTAPSGFKALCTQNLPRPTIQKPSSAMDVVTWTGNGISSRTISGLNFSPDFTWIKVRNTANSHLLYDLIRGASTGSASKALVSNDTLAEGSANDNSTYGYLSSFNSDGFGVTTGATGTYVNKTGDTYVAWSWDAGSTNSTNNSGSITSTVRANPQAGFSIVNFDVGSTTGARTIGHGLGVKPSIIITRPRDATDNWAVYHSSLGATKVLTLNSTAAALTSNLYWSDTEPTSSVFTGAAGGSNYFYINKTYIAYCFSEIEGYSKFGSYTGNGSTDGPFVWCGFRPRWILYKRTDAPGTNWAIYDTARDSFNVSNNLLLANTSDSEQTSYTAGNIDILSNGFKVRATWTGANASGGTYIFAAFAESAFKYCRAR